MVRYRYDDKDNLIELAVFDGNGKPATNSNDIHKYTQKFNNRNQCIETCYYNTNGELTRYSDHNYCIERTEFDERGQQVKVSYFDKNDNPVHYQNTQTGSYASMACEYDMYGRVIKQFYYDKKGAPTDPKVMVPEAVIEYDKWGNIVYIAAMDGKGNLIHNPQVGWSNMRREYDSKGNELWAAYYNEKQQAMLCSEGYHKVVYTYTSSNNIETSSYFDVSEKPMLVEGYHKEQYKYDENDNVVELVYLGKTGAPVNNTSGFSKLVITYHADQTLRDRKYYNTAGTVLLHQQYVNGQWVNVSNWQKDVAEFADELPQDLGEELENMIIQSARVVSSSRMEVVAVVPKSKYDMSNSMIESCVEILETLVEFIREELDIPRNVTVKGILKDSKGRELSTVTR